MGVNRILLEVEEMIGPTSSRSGKNTSIVDAVLLRHRYHARRDSLVGLQNHFAGAALTMSAAAALQLGIRDFDRLTFALRSARWRRW